MGYCNQLIRNALKEDIGKNDITTEAIIPPSKKIKAIILAKEDFLVCGLDIAREVFKTHDKNLKFIPLLKDAETVKSGKVVARIEGRAGSILTAERTALNFLSLLSGIATKTRKFVDAVRVYNVKIFDTRKTLPGLRELQKYAVRTGGGYNHRMRLDEMILIKDNHISIFSHQASVSGLENIIGQIRKKISNKLRIEIEVKNLNEFEEALKAWPDIIMLDNMKIPEIKKAVSIIRNTQYPIRNTLLEASGGITFKNIRQIAAAGIDMISIGDLTHSVDSVDISLEIA